MAVKKLRAARLSVAAALAVFSLSTIALSGCQSNQVKPQIDNASSVAAYNAQIQAGAQREGEYRQQHPSGKQQ